MNSSAANAATKTITKAKFGGGDMVRRTVGPVRYLGHLIGDGQWRGAGDKHPDGKTTLQAGSSRTIAAGAASSSRTNSPSGE
jgi:hypothetical protein